MAKQIKEETVNTVNTFDEVTPAEVAPETKPEKKPTTGVVANCTRLNVRTEPNKDATVETVIGKGCKVTISKGKSTKGWYKVTTETGVEGFCMKDFITIEE